MINDNLVLKNMRIFIGAMLAMIFLPYIGGYIYVHGHFPAGYFKFPPIHAEPKAPFCPVVFGIGLVLMAGFILFYLFPQIFGFKKIPPDVHPVKNQEARFVRFPFWFWGGIIAWAGTLFVLWMHFSEPVMLINWAVVPLFWGFTFMLDGIVYKRTGGKSLMTEAPREVIAIGVASVAGWLIFEYLNFFVDDNWCYPMGVNIHISEFVMYAVVGSSGLMPMALEWYSLFNTFDKFKYKYSYGPKIALPEWLKTAMIVIAFAVMFIMPFFPDIMFAALWVAPMIILAGALSKAKLWTPFLGLKDGNWSPMALCALSYGVQGILCECWNYFSGVHGAGGNVFSHNPDYWTYSIAYIDKYHVFEMPLLGLMGYLPFGVYCAVWWITFAYLLNIPTSFFDDGSKPISER